jgi:hypothetical protein
MVILLLLAVSLSIYIGIRVGPSDLQLVSRYSAFGISHLYTEQWFYLILFAVFGFIAAISHIAIATKLLIVKNKPLAYMFTWLGIIVLLLAFSVSSSVINVWSPV